MHKAWALVHTIPARNIHVHLSKPKCSAILKADQLISILALIITNAVNTGVDILPDKFILQTSVCKAVHSTGTLRDWICFKVRHKSINQFFYVTCNECMLKTSKGFPMDLPLGNP